MNYYYCDGDNILSFYMLQKCLDANATKKVDTQQLQVSVLDASETPHMGEPTQGSNH